MIALQPIQTPRNSLDLTRPVAPTTTTLTLCLAYFAYYNPKRPRRGGPLLRGDARRLASWLGSDTGRHAPQQDPALALHLIWLVAAGYLLDGEFGLRPTPAAIGRLHEGSPQPHACFLDDAVWERWDAAAVRLGLDQAVSPVYRHFARQSLERQAVASPTTRPPLALWEATAGEEWRLRLRPGSDPGLLFELLALGPYDPPGRLRLSALTLAAPPARDLGYDRVCWLLEAATAAPLEPEHRTRLREWLGRARAYRLRGPLLLTTHPEQLAGLYATRRLRPYLIEQISPRCALFDHAGLPALRRRLAVLGFPLDTASPGAAGRQALAPDVTPTLAQSATPHAGSDLAAHWLGLRLLAGLQRYIRLPVPPTHESLDRLSATLSAGDVAVLEAQADRLLEELHAVVQGRDAFFPARHTPPAALTARLRAAIAAEETITIDYCPTGAAEAKRHVVEPLRLEQRDELIYLVAHSHRAQTTLTFRLDRVRAVDSEQ